LVDNNNLDLSGPGQDAVVAKKGYISGIYCQLGDLLWEPETAIDLTTQSLRYFGADKLFVLEAGYDFLGPAPKVGTQVGPAQRLCICMKGSCTISTGFIQVLGRQEPRYHEILFPLTLEGNIIPFGEGKTHLNNQTSMTFGFKMLYHSPETNSKRP